MSTTSTPQPDTQPNTGATPTTNTTSTQVIKLTGGQSVLSFFARYGTLLVLALMLVGFSIAKPEAFMTQSNLINILNQSALLAIVSAGLTFILVSGEFDLSFGNTVSLTGIFTVGLFARQDLPVWMAIGIALVMAALVGLFNGFLVTVLKVNSIVATLGVSTVVLGVNFWYSNGSPITVSDQGFVGIARGQLFGVPFPVIIMLVIFVVLWMLMNRTLFGHHLQAVGSNATASRLAGVNVTKVTMWAFVIGALCAGIVGVVLSARIGSAQVTAGDGYLLGAFAAVFLGASVLRDGEFHIIGTLVGVFIVQVATNGFAILGAPTFVQNLIQGGILIAAVALSTTSRRVLGQSKR